MISKMIMYACMLIFSILFFTGFMFELYFKGFEDVISKHAGIIIEHAGRGFLLTSLVFLFIAAIIFIIKDGDA